MTRFTSDRAAYLRNYAWLAVLGMGGAMAILWAMGNPYVWTGAVAGLAAVVVRGWYLASEELAAVWEIKDATLIGPGGRTVALNQIETVRSIGNFVQVISRSGDKFLIKYQADPSATIAAIERVIG